MRETYVRPPLLGREPTSRALAVWPFRIVALLLLALLTWGFVLLVKAVLNPEAQAPGLGAQRPTASAAPF